MSAPPSSDEAVLISRISELLLRRLLSVAVLAAALPGLCGLSTALSPEAEAAPKDEVRVQVDLDGGADMLVDETRDRILVSQGTSGLAALDLSGARTGSLPGLTGSRDLLESADGSTIWVATSEERTDEQTGVTTTTSAVVGLDAGSLQQTARYDLPADSCAQQLTEDGAVLWFVETCSPWENRYLGSIDLATGDVTVEDEPRLQLAISSSSALPGRLYAVEAMDWSQDDWVLQRLDTSGGAAAPPTVVAQVSTPIAGPIAVMPAGDRLVTARGAYTTDDLAKLHPVGDTLGLAVPRADGYAAMALGSQASIFAPGENRPFDRILVDDGTVRTIGWGARDLYAIVDRHGSDTFRLVRHLPTRSTVLDVEVDSRLVRYRDRVDVEAVLRHGPADAIVEIVARPHEGPDVLIARGPVDADSVLRARVRLASETTFIARYAGTPGYAASKDHQRVKMRQVLTQKPVRYDRRQGTTSVYRTGKKAWFVITLRPTYSENRLYAVLEILDRGRWIPWGGTDSFNPGPDGRHKIYVHGTRGLEGRVMRISTYGEEHKGAGARWRTGWSAFTFR